MAMVDRPPGFAVAQRRATLSGPTRGPVAVAAAR